MVLKVFVPAAHSSPMVRCSACWPTACRRTCLLPQNQVEVELAGILEGRDRIEAVEIIRDRRAERRVPTAELAKTGSLGKLTFSSSGWFLVRDRE